MWNPFARKKKDEDEKKDEKDKTKPLVERLKDKDSTDLRAEEVLKKSAEACEVSGILDKEAVEKFKAAKQRTDTMRRRVKKNQENISSVLVGDEKETVQERALRELKELEEREARERAEA